MRPSRANALLAGVLVLLVAGLVLLATLQYRWIGVVSEAEQQRMQASLELEGRQFANEFQQELQNLADAFTEPDGGTVEERFEEWRSTAAHPKLAVSVSEVLPEEDQPGPPFDGDAFTITLRERRGRGDGFFPFRPEQMELPIRIQLDRQEFGVLMSDLTRKHFGDGYYVGLSARNDRVLFRSDASWPDGKRPPDVEVPMRILGPPAGRDGRPPRFGGRDEGENGPLKLLVRRHGGLPAMVAGARRRNLLVSAGILVILASAFGVLLYLLRRADRLREQQTEFVAAISHELNTPVTALRSAGENLKDGIITEPEKLARYGETIVKEAARLGEMIEQVLEFAGMRARKNGERREPIDVAALIDDAVGQTRWLVAGGSDIEFETHVDADLPQPSGDPRSLTRAIQNLIANAVRHGGSGGWVGVRATSDRDGHIAITVEDRGPGIDGRDAAHLFEPFYRGRESRAVRGSGLGLAIVKQVVAAHGGTVDVDRKRRIGAAFTITLPVEPNA